MCSRSTLSASLELGYNSIKENSDSQYRVMPVSEYHNYIVQNRLGLYLLCLDLAQEQLSLVLESGNVLASPWEGGDLGISHTSNSLQPDGLIAVFDVIDLLALQPSHPTHACITPFDKGGGERCGQLWKERACEH